MHTLNSNRPPAYVLRLPNGRAVEPLSYSGDAALVRPLASPTKLTGHARRRWWVPLQWLTVEPNISRTKLKGEPR